MPTCASLSFRRRAPSRAAVVRSWRLAIVLSLLAVAVLLRFWQDRSRPAAPENLAEGAYAVRRVVDGDTLLLENGARVRLIGVDTPETVKPDWPVEPFGPEASKFTKDFLSRGEVYLTFDLEKLDRYGRFLAYAWRDDRMEQLLNEEIVRAGLAKAKTGYRYSSSMKRRFSHAEDEAKTARRGIWSEKSDNPFE
jgi:micrococcal nuclease